MKTKTITHAEREAANDLYRDTQRAALYCEMLAAAAKVEASGDVATAAHRRMAAAEFRDTRMSTRARRIAAKLMREAAK